MTDLPDPLAFSHEWEAAWNRGDVEAVLEHFHDDAVFTSAIAWQLGFADDGVVTGKAALRAYWTTALTKNPGLHFEITAIYGGVRTLVIAYKTQAGTDRVEVLTFKDRLVIEGHGMSMVPAGAGMPLR